MFANMIKSSHACSTRKKADDIFNAEDIGAIRVHGYYIVKASP